MPYSQLKQVQKRFELAIDPQKFENSTNYRNRVDYAINLLNGQELSSTSSNDDHSPCDVINLERDFILGYN